MDPAQRQSATDPLSPIIDTRGPDPHPATPSVDEVTELVLDGDHAVQWIAGALDATSSARVLTVGGLALADPHANMLTVDCSAVARVEPAGVEVLIRLFELARTCDKYLRLRRVPSQLNELLVDTPLEQLIGDPKDAQRC